MIELIRRISVEIIIGFVILAIGVMLKLWSKQLYWIEIYPLLLGKQILDLLPDIFWIAGCLLIADSLWRFSASKRAINLRFTSSVMVGIAITLSSILYSREVLWPDFYHIEYGFPFAWLTRILMTIAGPVNYFVVNFSMFVLDTIFWFVMVLTTSWLWAKIYARKKRNCRIVLRNRL